MKLFFKTKIKNYTFKLINYFYDYKHIARKKNIEKKNKTFLDDYNDQFDIMIIVVFIYGPYHETGISMQTHAA